MFGQGCGLYRGRERRGRKSGAVRGVGDEVAAVDRPDVSLSRRVWADVQPPSRGGDPRQDVPRAEEGPARARAAAARSRRRVSNGRSPLLVPVFALMAWTWAHLLRR